MSAIALVLVALVVAYVLIGYGLLIDACPGLGPDEWPLSLWVAIQWPWKAKEWRS